mmetsp:Transcript_12182/g.10486  ORF Transcript_12182/g.10486 Transcript_12182/m.10486 type:complete len:157 (+) Transcript_12182:741-1211(+)
MDKVLDLTLNNAWKQKKYAETYAELCSFLGSSKVLKFDTEENKTKKNDFKFFGTRKISQLFKKEILDFDAFEETKSIEPEERADFLLKIKNKFSGMLIFFAYLATHKFIPLKILEVVTAELFTKFLDQYTKYNGEDKNRIYETYLDGLIQMIEKSG